MQLQKSWSDVRREARAAREVEHFATPAGYPTNRGPGIAVMNLNKPGAFAAMQRGDTKAFVRSQGVPFNTTGIPASNLSPPARVPVAVVSSANPYRASDPYANTNQGYWSNMESALHGSFVGSELGDFLTDLTQGITAAATAYGQVTANEAQLAMARVGIQPVGYSQAGTPIYQSTPAGVTPQYAQMVPSGMVLPAGVTASYPYPVGFAQQGGASGVYQIQPPSFMGDSKMLLPALAIGGGLLLLFAFMK